MSDRRSKLLWMKDLLDHLVQCQDQLQEAESPEATHFLTQAMLLDLQEYRQLCLAMKPNRSSQPLAMAIQ